MSTTLSVNPAIAMEQVSQQTLVQKKIAMDSLRSRLGDTRTKDEQLREACEGFESVFIQKMWEQMRKTVPKEGYLHSKDEETYQSMFDVELSKKMAASGGIGLADMMYQQLSQQVTDTARATSSKLSEAPQKNASNQQSAETQEESKLVPLIPLDKLTPDALYSSFSQDEFAYDEQADAPFVAPVASTHILGQKIIQDSQHELQQKAAQAQTVSTQPHVAEVYPEYAEESENIAAALAEIRAQTAMEMNQNTEQMAQLEALQNSIQSNPQINKAPQNIAEQNTTPQNIVAHDAVATTVTTPDVTNQPFGMTAEQVYQMMAAQTASLEQHVSVQSPTAQGTFFEQENTQTAPVSNINAFVTPLSVAPENIDKNIVGLENVQEKAPSKVSSKGMLPASAVWPHHGKIFSQFGWQNNPEAGMKREWNAGIGIAAKPDDQIIPCLPGTVAYIGEREQFGNTVVLEHEGGFTSYYGNVTPINLNVGDTVKSGTSFAKISTNPSFRQSGEKNSPLFFELKRGEMSLNPEAALNSTRTASM